MKDKRFLRSLPTALLTASVGLFWCMAAFFLLWGGSVGAKLLPFLLFVPAFAVSVVALLLIRKRKR